VSFIANKSQTAAVDLYPIGAVSKGTKGVDLAELIDMYASGAVAFSDGNRPINDEGLLLRALQYAKRFDGLIIDQPLNHEISPEAQVHEGMSSTLMGLKGMPTTAEVSRINRNIEIAKYSESRLCLHLISTKEGLEVLKDAAKDNDNLYATTGVFSLCYTEDDVFGFDHNLKLMPPLRSSKDRNALLRGIQKGQIQVICSQHVPLEEELKEMAFFDSSPGSISLQTTFAMLISSVQGEVDLETLIKCLCHNPRTLLGVDIPTIDERQPFNATLFHPNLPWTFTRKNNLSKSKNTSAFDQEFAGCVIGSFNNSVAHWNISV
jgi:dihydroorotase